MQGPARWDIETVQSLTDTINIILKVTENPKLSINNPRAILASMIHPAMSVLMCSIEESEDKIVNKLNRHAVAIFAIIKALQKSGIIIASDEDRTDMERMN